MAAQSQFNDAVAESIQRLENLVRQQQAQLAQLAADHASENDAREQAIADRLNAIIAIAQPVAPVEDAPPPVPPLPVMAQAATEPGD